MLISPAVLFYLSLSQQRINPTFFSSSFPSSFSSRIHTPGFVHYLCPELLLGQFHLLHCCWFTGPCKLWWNPAPVCRGSPTTSLSLRPPSLSVNYLLFIVLIIVHSTLESKTRRWATPSTFSSIFLLFFFLSWSPFLLSVCHSSPAFHHLQYLWVCFTERKKKRKWLIVCFARWFNRFHHFFFPDHSSFQLSRSSSRLVPLSWQLHPSLMPEWHPTWLPFSSSFLSSKQKQNKITWRDWTTQVK